MKSPFFPVRGQRGRTAERRGAAAPGILAGVLAAAVLLAAPFSSASLGPALRAAGEPRDLLLNRPPNMGPQTSRGKATGKLRHLPCGLQAWPGPGPQACH